MASYINWTSGFPAAGSQAQSSALGSRDRKLRDLDSRHFPSMTYTTKGPTLLWAHINSWSNPSNVYRREKAEGEVIRVTVGWMHQPQTAGKSDEKPTGGFCRSEQRRSTVLSGMHKLHIPWISTYCEPLREGDFRVTQTPLFSACTLPYCVQREASNH